MTFSSPPSVPRRAPVNFTRRHPSALACSIDQSLWVTSLRTSPPKPVPWMHTGVSPRCRERSRMLRMASRVIVRGYQALNSTLRTPISGASRKASSQ